MGLSEILQSVLDYNINFNVGGGDFVFGISLAGLVALAVLGMAWKKWSHMLPLVGDKKK